GPVTVDPEGVSPHGDAARLPPHLDPGGDAVRPRIDAHDRPVAEVADPEITETAVLGTWPLPRGDPRRDACGPECRPGDRRLRRYRDQHDECENAPVHNRTPCSTK